MHSLLNLLLGATFRADIANLIVLSGDVLAVMTIPSILLRRQGSPAAALSWSLGVLVVPFLGVATWWLLGRTHLSRYKLRRMESQQRLCEKCPPIAEAPSGLPEAIRAVTPFALSDRRWQDGVFPPAHVASTSVLADRDAFPAMEQAIEDATTEILAMFYIWKVDATGKRMAELLARSAERGVKVAVIVDAVGGAKFLKHCAASLRQAGVKVASFLPAKFGPWSPTFNFRNHRKLLVVDGTVAFTGGMNVADEYANDWRDLMVRLKGPVVRNLRGVFVEDWHFAAADELARVSVNLECTSHDPRDVQQDPDLCTVIASGPDRRQNLVHDGFFQAILSAQSRIYLTTPYFIPSTPILEALRAAAQRGVNVHLLVPETPDVWLVALATRVYLRSLLRSGVKVFAYDRMVLHAKTLVVDDTVGVVGSANTDNRSFKLNFELTCFLFSSSVNASLAQVFEDDVAASAELTENELTPTSKLRQVVESLAHLVSPLL